MKRLIERSIRFVAIVLGPLIVISCTAVGSSDGIPGALAGFAAGIVGVVFVLGWVYGYQLLRKDIDQLSGQLDALERRQLEVQGAQPGAMPTEASTVAAKVEAPP